ncbi:MAG: 50S ribosomal protein L37 [Thaumarchaeota archaeon]|nr:50S ribosomal protein L37 [Nitrososphaerota archaeon]
MGRSRSKPSLKGLAQKYGGSVRKRYSRVYRLLKQKRQCPECGSLKFKRESAGIWVCGRCSFKVAGGAYDVAA